MEKISILKKIIREELRAVIKEELPKILNEKYSREDRPKNYANSILESKEKSTKIPNTLNTVNTPRIPKFDSRNPMAKFLAETAESMANSDDTVYFDSSNVNANGFDLMTDNAINKTRVVSGVGDMLRSSVPSSDPSMVQINAVPDFTNLMAKLKEKGAI
jgi:hypothetical protein